MNRKQRRSFQKQAGILHKSPIATIRTRQEEAIYRKAIAFHQKEEGTAPEIDGDTTISTVSL